MALRSFMNMRTKRTQQSHELFVAARDSPAGSSSSNSQHPFQYRLSERRCKSHCHLNFDPRVCFTVELEITWGCAFWYRRGSDQDLCLPRRRCSVGTGDRFEGPARRLRCDHMEQSQDQISGVRAMSVRLPKWSDVLRQFPGHVFSSYSME